MRPRALAVLRAVANRNASGLAVTQNSATGLKFRPSMVGIALAHRDKDVPLARRPSPQGGGENFCAARKTVTDWRDELILT